MAALCSDGRTAAIAVAAVCGMKLAAAWPYLLARYRDAHVVATDIDADLAAQGPRRARAEHAGIARRSDVSIVRCDARHIPFRDGAVDAATAVSAIEHVRGADGDRMAVRELARVLRPAGRAWLTVPFRHAGSMVELDDAMEHFQWHYSPHTLQESLVGPAGLVQRGRMLYGERLPYYKATRRLPEALRWMLRPWDSLISAALIHPTTDASRASAALVELARPEGAGEQPAA